MYACLDIHTQSQQMNSQARQWFTSSDQLPLIRPPLIQPVENVTSGSPGCLSGLVLIQSFFLFHVGSLSYVESLLHPIQFYTSFPHKPVRDVMLITQKSPSAVVPASFFNEYRLHCMYSITLAASISIFIAKICANKRISKGMAINVLCELPSALKCLWTAATICLLHFNAFLMRQQGMVKITLALESHIPWSTIHQLCYLFEPQCTGLPWWLRG